MKKNKIFDLYLELRKKFGDPVKYWPQWCAGKKSLKLKEEIALEAILVQRTSWRNAEIASKNLKKVGLLSIRGILGNKDFEKLVSLVRPAGFYTTKPRRLMEFCRFISQNYNNWEKFIGEDQKIAREKLLKVYGIGPETADTILLYAAEKPTFVIDEYTRKFVKSKGLTKNLDDYSLKDLFEKSLPPDPKLFQNDHALIIFEVKDGKNIKMGMI